MLLNLWNWHGFLGGCHDSWAQTFGKNQNGIVFRWKIESTEKYFTQNFCVKTINSLISFLFVFSVWKCYTFPKILWKYNNTFVRSHGLELVYRRSEINRNRMYLMCTRKKTQFVNSITSSLNFMFAGEHEPSIKLLKSGYQWISSQKASILSQISRIWRIVFNNEQRHQSPHGNDIRCSFSNFSTSMVVLCYVEIFRSARVQQRLWHQLMKFILKIDTFWILNWNKHKINAQSDKEKNH